MLGEFYFMLCTEKKEMRTEIKKLNKTLTLDYCINADTQIHQNIINIPEYEKAQTIFCYVSMHFEVNTKPLIADALKKKKLVGVPRCVSQGMMQAHRLFSLETDLTPGNMGILEPAPNAPIITPESFDLVIVPCCTCSHDGKRLGFGGGFYDRYLTQTTATNIIICREQIMREDIPTDAHDLIMDIVISEKGIWRI